MVTGLIVGFVLGLLVGPILRSWLTWKQYLEASREAQLHEEILRLMSQSPTPSQGSAGGKLGSAGRP
jgi:Na+/glutamate symporter